MKYGKSRNFGFTLLEVIVATLVTGVAAAGTYAVFEAMANSPVLVSDQLGPEQQLSVADTAVLGFVFTYNRLPCPADPEKNHGYEAVTGVSQTQFDPTTGKQVIIEGKTCQLAVGDFPAKTLNVEFPARVHIRYGVYRDDVGGSPLSLANTQRTYTPFVLRTDVQKDGTSLLPSVAEGTAWPWATTVETKESTLPQTIDDFNRDPNIPSDIKSKVSTTLKELDVDIINTLKDVEIKRLYPTPDQVKDARLRINGLDLCASLRAMQQDDNRSTKEFAVGPDAPVAVAYALAHSGAADKDRNNNPFDGSNQGKVFELPNTPQSETYDDSVLSVSFAELSGRLQCPKYLARADAAAATALAAYDNYRFALGFLEWRSIELDLAAARLLTARASSFRAFANTFNTVVLNMTRRVERLLHIRHDRTLLAGASGGGAGSTAGTAAGSASGSPGPTVIESATGEADHEDAVEGLAKPRYWESYADIVGDIVAAELLERGIEKDLQTDRDYKKSVSELKKAKKNRIDAEEYAERMRNLADEAALRMITIDERGLQL